MQKNIWGDIGQRCGYIGMDGDGEDAGEEE